MGREREMSDKSFDKEFKDKEKSTEDREKSVDMGEDKEEPIRESLEDSEDLEDREREMTDKSFDREFKDEEESAEDWEGEEKLRKQKPDSGADELQQPKEKEVSENADELTVAALEADEGSDLSQDQKSEKDSKERVRDFMKKDKPIDQ